MATARVNGVDLFYELSGPEDGSVVVFSNSLGSAINMWDAVTPALAANYRCLRYDTRGHGRSGSADVAVTVDDLADDLIGLLDALNIGKLHLVGLSLGGMTGQSLGARHPERIASLTLIATSAYLPPVEFWEKRAADVRAAGPESIADNVMERWFTAPFRQKHPESVAAVRQSLLKADRAGYARCCGAISAMDFRERLPRIAAPTVVIVGTEDPVTTPAMAEVLRAGIPGSELIVIPRAAHLISVERADAIASYANAFITRLDPPSARRRA